MPQHLPVASPIVSPRWPLLPRPTCLPGFQRRTEHDALFAALYLARYHKTAPFAAPGGFRHATILKGQPYLISEGGANSVEAKMIGKPYHYKAAVPKKGYLYLE